MCGEVDEQAGRQAGRQLGYIRAEQTDRRQRERRCIGPRDAPWMGGKQSRYRRDGGTLSDSAPWAMDEHPGSRPGGEKG